MRPCIPMRPWMKTILLLALAAALHAATPVRIIYETDMNGDCDDAGALAVLHALADRGECEIIACMSNTPNLQTPAAIDAINTWYGRPDIPIGKLAEASGGGGYPAALASEFPHDTDPSSVPEAVDLYRQILAAGPDRGTTIVSVGFLTNLGRLLRSAPDGHSTLNGYDLVALKVDRLVCMGGRFPSGYEYNFRHREREETKEVVDNWSAPVVYSGYEIGDSIATGPRLWTETTAANPVRRAYQIYLGWTADSQRSRPSWDQTAAYYAVRGGDGLWTLEDTGSCTFDVGSGQNVWVDSPDPSGREDEAYFVQQVSDATVATIIEDLMVEPPLLGAAVPDFTTSANDLTLTVDASTSFAGGGIAAYAWDFGDGGSGSGVITSHSYAAPGIYPVTLTLTDNEGRTSSTSRSVSVSDGTPNNQPDPQLNLALLASANLSGSASGQLRGAPVEICYDPAAGRYAVPTQWNEYGEAYGENLGRPGAGSGFHWQAAWPHPKRINYLTFGGTYPNQAQPNTLWRIRYRSGGSWTTLAEGQGGWIDSGIFEWGGAAQQPITADAVRVEAYSDGAHDLVSIHLRARGGQSYGEDDRGTATKACLIQLLGDWDEPPEPPVGGGVEAHWRFDEGGGSNVADSLGDHDGTLTGGDAAWVPGITGNALRFGSGRHVDVPSDPAFGTAALTIATWVRFDDVSGNWRALVEHGRGGGNWFGLFKRASQPVFHFRWGPNSSTQTVDGTTALAADTWYHVAATYDPDTGEARIYLDGALDASRSGPASTPEDGGLRFGLNQSGGEALPGDLDEIRFYDRALSAGEVAALAGAPNRPPAIEPGVITLRGSALDPEGSAVAVTVDGVDVPLVGGNWQIDVPAVAGENLYTVIAVDAEGNATSRTVAVTWGPGAPLGSG